MDEKQKESVRRILAKPVGEYTPDESRFMENMMRAYPAAFAEVLEGEVRKLRQAADELRARTAPERESEHPRNNVPTPKPEKAPH